MTPLENVKGVGSSLAVVLNENGITDAETLAATTQKQLEAISGIGAQRAGRLLIAAQSVVLTTPASAPATPDGRKTATSGKTPKTTPAREVSVSEVVSDAAAIPAALVKSIKAKAAKKLKTATKALEKRNAKLKAKTTALKAKNKAAEKKAKAAEKKADAKAAAATKAKKAARKAKSVAKKAKSAKTKSTKKTKVK